MNDWEKDLKIYRLEQAPPKYENYQEYFDRYFAENDNTYLSFVRFAIGTIVDVDGISYEVGLQYSLDGHTYVKAAGGTFIKCDKNIAGVDKGDNYVEELDTSCYYYEEVISS